MKTNRERWFVWCLAAWLSVGGGMAGEGTEVGEFEALPQVRSEGGRALLSVLRDRRSVRVFESREVPRAVLGELLWAAFGVNREGTGRRTAPSTMDLRAMDVYVVTAGGAWRYDAERHGLVRVGAGDVRRLTGGQEYVKTAPVALLYVADHRRMGKVPAAERGFYAAADAGFIGQNVYLYCASEGLGAVVHMPGEAGELGKALGLALEQRVVLVHSVGYPGEEPEGTAVK